MTDQPYKDEPVRGQFRTLTADAAWELIFRHRESGPQGGDIKGLAVFDVRDQKSFVASRVDGAQALTEAGFAAVIAQLPKTTPIVVYCYQGHASQTFARMFSDFGFAEVYSVDGGFEALRTALDQRARPADERPSLPLPRPYLPGDTVFSRKALYNDGGVPVLAADALIAPERARGVIVKIGTLEADPGQQVYLVRFEAADGVLGLPVGCLADELTQEEPPNPARSAPAQP